MPAKLLRQIGFFIVPDLAMAVAFALAWFAPGSGAAASPAECRQIMLLEGCSVIVSPMVGGYLNVSLVFLPPILILVLGYLVCVGAAGRTWLLYAFVWHIISCFIEGVRAHRGGYGSARENPAHPHRRYDRMVFVYVGTAPLVLALWVAGDPSRWAVWGTVYFTLYALVDSVLRKQFDRIPQGILRRLRARLAAEAAPKMGLCFYCVHLQPAIPARPGRLVRCALSATDPRFPEYPATPVTACTGFRRPVGN